MAKSHDTDPQKNGSFLDIYCQTSCRLVHSTKSCCVHWLTTPVSRLPPLLVLLLACSALALLLWYVPHLVPYTIAREKTWTLKLNALCQQQKFRTERDTFGDLQVPSESLWGAQTQRLDFHSYFNLPSIWCLSYSHVMFCLYSDHCKTSISAVPVNVCPSPWFVLLVSWRRLLPRSTSPMVWTPRSVMPFPALLMR